MGYEQNSERVGGSAGGGREGDGRFVLPGVVEAHMHVFWLGEQLLRWVDLEGEESVEGILGRLRESAVGRDEGAVGRERWVLGRGVNPERLAEKRMPTGAELDAALPGRAALVSRICGHVGVLSSVARGRLPEGVRAAGGEGGEGGVFEETAFWGALGSVPKLSEGEMEEAAMLALRQARERGFSAVGTILERPGQWKALRNLAERGELPVAGVTAHVPAVFEWEGKTVRTADELKRVMEVLYGAEARSGWGVLGDDRLRMGAVKFFSDGTLGARTAWLAEPYSDAPQTRGKQLLTREEMEVRFRAVHEAGWQVAVHAIGDAALRDCVGALSGLGQGGGNALRHRIEHAAVCPPDCLEEMARCDLLAVVQPQFVRSDTWMRERLGERVKWAYRFGAMERAGVKLALSSDCPVERLDVGACLAGAVAGHGWNNDGAMTRAGAVGAYTAGARYAGWMERVGETRADVDVMTATTAQIEGGRYEGVG